MGTLLQVIGFGWALLGLGNLVGMFGKGPSEGLATFGLLLNVVLFILPGLGLGALGTMLKRRGAASSGEDARVAAAVQRALAEERARPAGTSGPPGAPDA